MKVKSLTPSQFNKLGQRIKAVLVAKDVIKQLNANIYQTTSGSYINLTYRVPHNSADLLDARACLLKPKDIKLECTVCARGALFLSGIRFKDKLTLEDIDSADVGGSVLPHDERESTKGIFSHRQILLIEAAFEGFCNFECEDGSDLYIADIIKSYYYSFGTNSNNASENRLIGIMKNIIRNKGVFIIPRQFFPSQAEYMAAVKYSKSKDK